MAAFTWKKLNLKKFVSKYNYISFRKKYYENIYQIFSKALYKESVSILLTQCSVKKRIMFNKIVEFISCLPGLKHIEERIECLDFEKEKNMNVNFIHSGCFIHKVNFRNLRELLQTM
jgi:hypothetical protein